jgi:hypothetical protein
MLEKIFSWSKKAPGEEAQPDITFGRYSDNNKSMVKVDRWNAADALFKEKKIVDSIAAFFEYLTDEVEQNVVHTSNGNTGTFYFYQGSKIVHGSYDEENFQAATTLALMPNPSVPVMRRLLEMNFTLYYSRYSLDDEKVFMQFNSDIATANPSKLYYGLKELATKTDKQDDLLVQDFAALQSTGLEHLIAIPDEEKEVKFKYFKLWIGETLNMINGIDMDKYSGGIAYLLLALAYRIDYLIVPEGKMLLELEKIVEIYFRKDDRPVTEKNQEMIDAYQKLLEREKADFFPYLFRSKYTFSIVTPQNFKTIADAIYNANQNVGWYKESKLPAIAAKISEYGLSYCQYSYSLPKPVTEYFHLFMMVNYGDFFKELGFTDEYYRKETGEYNKEGIFQRIAEIETKWREKYPELKLNTEKIKFDNEVAFNQSFVTEIEYLNLETK